MTIISRVKLSTVIVCVAVASVTLVSPTPALAQSTKPLKGKWTLTLQTPFGALPLPVTFRKNGRGIVEVSGQRLPLAYREDATSFSFSFEWDGPLAPGGQNLSVVIRGVKTSKTALTGTAILISEFPDPASPIQVQAQTEHVTGQRQ